MVVSNEGELDAPRPGAPRLQQHLWVANIAGDKAWDMATAEASEAAKGLVEVYEIMWAYLQAKGIAPEFEAKIQATHAAYQQRAQGPG